MPQNTDNQGDISDMTGGEVREEQQLEEEEGQFILLSDESPKSLSELYQSSTKWIDKKLSD